MSLRNNNTISVYSGHFTIWFKSVTCRGKEKRLTDCSYDLATAQNSLSYSQNGCSNRNLAGVSCHTPYGAYQDQVKTESAVCSLEKMSMR